MRENQIVLLSCYRDRRRLCILRCESESGVRHQGTYLICYIGASHYIRDDNKTFSYLRRIFFSSIKELYQSGTHIDHFPTLYILDRWPSISVFTAKATYLKHLGRLLGQRRRGCRCRQIVRWRPRRGEWPATQSQYPSSSLRICEIRFD